MKPLRIITRVISRLCGALAELPLPIFLRKPVIGGFSRLVGVDLSECSSPIEAFPSVQSFFLRDLKERAFGDSFVSPVDGTLSEYGVISKGELMQAKGRSYLLSELLGDGSLAAQFEGGLYLTLYLAPRDYHHVHAPKSGTIVEVRSISGALFPVNRWSVSTFDRVFSRNERVVLKLRVSDTTEIVMVMVGALNVGSLQLARKDLSPPAALWDLFFPRQIESRSCDWRVELGERIGSFRLGSTVVLALPPGFSEIDMNALCLGKSVRFGECFL
jgi:phosphatidylserine decarboxylase